MAIRFARSPAARIALGLGLAALAQLLSLLLAGAGHGWVTPLFMSVALWVLLPLTLYIVPQNDRRARLVLMVIAIIAAGADFLLIKGTIREGDVLRSYVQVNGAVGLLIIGLWLCLWCFWQAMLVRALVAGRRSADANA